MVEAQDGKWSVRKHAYSAMVALLVVTLGCAAQEEYERAPSHSKAVVAPEKRVDLNSASVDELVKIPGMTHTWALRIVRYKPYRVKTDLIEQGIVTPQVYERIREFVIVHRAAKSPE